MVLALASPNFWTEEDNLKKFLAVQLKTGKLRLVLGAGASIGFGLPNWNDLISNLSKVCGNPVVVNDGNREEITSKLWRSMGRDRVAFAKKVHEALYMDYETSMGGLTSNPLASALAAICVATTRTNKASVISFNYDNLLEQFLRYYGFRVRSIDALPAWDSNHDVTVLHGHGLLEVADASSAKGVVLTPSDYDKIHANEDSVLWRKKYMSVMKSATCLFIGLSGQDSNLRQILAETKKEHPATAEYSAFWGVRLATEKNPDAWEEHGVYEHVVQGHDQIPHFLFDICQIASKLRY